MKDPVLYIIYYILYIIYYIPYIIYHILYIIYNILYIIYLISYIIYYIYMYIYTGLLGKYALFLSDCKETWIFSTDFRKKKNTQISDFVKFCPVGAELFHADKRRDRQTDRQTDMTKLIVALCNFASAPKNKKASSYSHISIKAKLHNKPTDTRGP